MSELIRVQEENSKLQDQVCRCSQRLGQRPCCSLRTDAQVQIKCREIVELKRSQKESEMFMKEELSAATEAMKEEEKKNQGLTLALERRSRELEVLKVTTTVERVQQVDSLSKNLERAQASIAVSEKAKAALEEEVCGS